jgi:hypothetical protein
MATIDDREAEELCCAQCRRKVSKVTRPDGTVYYGHPGSAGHKVQPVLAAPADIIRFCDFCLSTDIAWAFPLRDRADTLSPVDPATGYPVRAVDTDGWWAACDQCAALVRERAIGALRDRAMAAMGAAVRRDWNRGMTAWERQSVIMQLAAFWLGVPGEAVSWDGGGEVQGGKNGDH